VTKKGDNLIYGLRYARVIGRTWWRERQLAARGTRRPAAPASGEPVPASSIPTTQISASKVATGSVSTSSVSTGQGPQQPAS
jgi:hypothetical protein